MPVCLALPPDLLDKKPWGAQFMAHPALDILAVVE